jgi:hypothetical protein
MIAISSPTSHWKLTGRDPALSDEQRLGRRQEEGIIERRASTSCRTSPSSSRSTTTRSRSRSSSHACRHRCRRSAVRLTTLRRSSPFFLLLLLLLLLGGGGGAAYLAPPLTSTVRRHRRHHHARRSIGAAFGLGSEPPRPTRRSTSTSGAASRIRSGHRLGCRRRQARLWTTGLSSEQQEEEGSTRTSIPTDPPYACDVVLVEKSGRGGGSSSSSSHLALLRSRNLAGFVGDVGGGSSVSERGGECGGGEVSICFLSPRDAAAEQQYDDDSAAPLDATLSSNLVVVTGEIIS